MRGASLGLRPLKEKELEEIDPQITANLDMIKRKKKIHYVHMRDLRGLHPTTDEDVENICGSIFKRLGRPRTRREKDGSQSLTPEGCLEIDVGKIVKELSEKGFTKKGREKVKEKIIYSLIHDFAWWEYRELREGILNSFSAEENEKIREGTIRRLESHDEDISPFLYDKQIFDFYDFTKWRKCYKDYFNCTVEIMEIAFDECIYRKSKEIEAKIEVHEKEIDESQKQKERRLSHICVLSYIYAIKWVEKIIEVDFLKSNVDLYEIWNIKEATFYNRMKYLYLVDNRDLE